MLWAALATLIMAMTGAGDDTFAFREFLTKMQEAIEREVHDPARQRQAVTSVEQTLEGFRRHREAVNEVSTCFEKVDRTYAAKRADYEACLHGMQAHWDHAATELIQRNAQFRKAVTPAELTAIEARVQLQ